MKTAIINLGLIAAICGLLISSLFALSRPTIEENKKRYATQKLQTVLGSRDTLTQLNDSLYYSSVDNQLTGFLFEQSTTEGYNGVIKSWIAIDEAQNIRGVRVFEHQETPGIGDKIDIRVADWITRFNGTSLSRQDWRLRKDDGDFDHFSGATITSRALVNSVKTGLEYSQRNLDNWSKMVDQQQRNSANSEQEPK